MPKYKPVPKEIRYEILRHLKDGGLSEVLDINYLIHKTGELLLPALKRKVKIEKSILGNNAGLLGATLLASQAL